VPEPVAPILPSQLRHGDPGTVPPAVLRRCRLTPGVAQRPDPRSDAVPDRAVSSKKHDIFTTSGLARPRNEAWTRSGKLLPDSRTFSDLVEPENVRILVVAHFFIEKCVNFSGNR
jgi:hypothetical protein